MIEVDIKDLLSHLFLTLNQKRGKMCEWLETDCPSIIFMKCYIWALQTSNSCSTQRKKALRTWACIQIRDNCVMLSALCLTACLLLLCRWRWMQTISAIAHAPKVSAPIHTHTHTHTQPHSHSGWPSLPQHTNTSMHRLKHTHLLYTHRCTNPRLPQLIWLSSLLSLLLLPYPPSALFLSLLIYIF